MARYYKKYFRKKDDSAEKINMEKMWEIFFKISKFFIFSLVLLLFTNESVFWEAFWGLLSFISGLILFIMSPIIIWSEAETYLHKQKLGNILSAIRQAELEEHIKNFISRFGLGQEKSKNVWMRRNYSIAYERIDDLRNFLAHKEIKLSSSDIIVLLSFYIDERERTLTYNSISVITHNFSQLSGPDFERLLYRLYEAMGYTVQLIGKTGDQGGDLIITKDQERILIQAKCYINMTIGNSAVQEAVAARGHYNCNIAMVVATNSFTKEATELAATNNIKLIPKDLLQKLLLDYLKESWQ